MAIPLTRPTSVHHAGDFVFAADSMWDRTVYDGRRTGPVAFVEERDRMIGPIFAFAVRGKF